MSIPRTRLTILAAVLAAVPVAGLLLARASSLSVTAQTEGVGTGTTTLTTISSSQTCTIQLAAAGTSGTGDADTYIDAASTGTVSGAASTMTVSPRTNPSDRRKRAFVKFDLANDKCAETSAVIPSTATVTLAKLNLTTNCSGTCTAATTETFGPASASWIETGTGALTWANGSTITASGTESVSIPASIASGTVISLTVTPDVQSFLTAANNKGWMIHDDTGSVGNAASDYIYVTREGTTSTQRPQLVVTYH